MNYTKFKVDYISVWMSSQGDDVFSTIKVLTAGMTNVRFAKLLNFAVSCMDPHEVYVEVGTFTGTTMISAGYYTSRLIFGIDNFDIEGKNSSIGASVDKDTVRKRLDNNLRYFQTNCNFVESDFRNVPLGEIPVGVALIDGRHDYANVWDNFLWLENNLVKDALIFCDDTNMEGVSEAIFDWLKAKKNFELVYYHTSEPVPEKSIIVDSICHNGMAILHYKGKENGL